jgi:LuxR family maltose regulon positive regulatory protein
MPIELIASKLRIPPRRPNLVQRLRLIQLLNEGPDTKRKLTLISAPAGFGKTTLVVEWLKQTNLPAAWLSLDEADNNLPQFLAYLAAAVHQVDEQIGIPLHSILQSPQPPSLEMALTGLLNEIARRTDPLILILDDVHLITNAEILQAMEFLLRHQPPQLHLVLTTREDPDLPLARLRARDQLTEIRARDLRFTKAEADTFLRSVMGIALSEQDVATLEDRTEGWAAGLQLAGLSLQKQADRTTFITGFSGSHRHILDYLTYEVLQKQPDEIRTFLLQTAILDRLCAPLCDALTGRIDSAKILAYLETANLFLIPLDEERLWYRYHHLFSDLLRNQLARAQPESIPELHRRASRWYEENGDIQAAVEHALRDTDLTQAAQLIERHALPKLYEGQVTRVLGWFDRLPEAALECAPMLCISKAWALAMMQRGSRRNEVEGALHTAEQALELVNAGKTLRELVAGHTATIEVFLLQRSALRDKEPQRLIDVATEAQKRLPAEEKANRSVTALSIGYGYLALANLDAARGAFERALEDGIAGRDFYAAIYGPINLVLIALLMGQLTEALQLCDTNIERFNRILAGENFPPIGALYILKGSILLEYDQVAEAEQSLTEGLDLIHWTGESLIHTKGYTTLARLRAIQGDRPAMLEAVKGLEEIWSERALYIRALRHCLSIRHWPDDLDMQKDAEIWLNQSGKDFDELVIIDSVNHSSLALFESYLNAAHVLARLSKGESGMASVEGLQAYLKRQQDFAEAHGIVSWVVSAALTRTLLHQATGQRNQALKTLEVAVKTAAPTGLFRIFLDEGKPLQALLEELRLQVTDKSVIAYADRLSEAFGGGAAKTESGSKLEALLSERELEVLRDLASGLSYEEIGQQLFLSLNTVQTHVKHIYRKLLVNKRTHAIEKARQLKLI